MRKFPILLAEVKIGEEFGFGNLKSLGQATDQLVGPIFSIATFVVILYFLLGAFKYMKAGGNKEDVESARMMILHAIIGFIVLMFAFLILQYLVSSLFGLGSFEVIQTQ